MVQRYNVPDNFNSEVLATVPHHSHFEILVYLFHYFNWFKLKCGYWPHNLQITFVKVLTPLMVCQITSGG